MFYLALGFILGVGVGLMIRLWCHFTLEYEGEPMDTCRKCGSEMDGEVCVGCNLAEGFCQCGGAT